MEHFNIVDHCQCILLSRGVYKQAQVYRLGNVLFAKNGGGFVRLLAGGGTSVTHVSWKDMDISIAPVEKTGGHINAPRWVGDDAG